ncbi:hypothetical protein GCM10010919_04530 [Alishewanella longhuensis]|uniref:Response regulatory domain-containing protein n=1 Tax=Alishewanella longhuensis TaxID=1091037 RepID=A0ABQ3KTS4_9ALTE|nr:response regulator [Alishewanella longhuensis]GHG60799.1 hypothetical protein GCM10010919_04530 [Alishewanella longhuensis]
MPEVLFVDDEPFVLDAYRRMLRNSIFRCHTLAKSQDVLAYLQQHNIDIVVADQQMPHLSGIALLETLQDKYPNIKRVLISGNLNLVQQAPGTLLDTVLEKPCSQATLIANLELLVNTA